MPAVTTTIAESAKMAEETLGKLISRSGKSSPILLKDPATPTPPGWHLWLPSHFNTALDLRFIWKQQVKNKEIVRKWKEWVQGSNFCFHEGSIIYDRDVSLLETWGDKLDAIDFYVNLGVTRPVALKTSVDPVTGLTKVSRDPGSVHCRIYRPIPSHSSVLSEEVTVTQDEFVRFAISGTL